MPEIGRTISRYRQELCYCTIDGSVLGVKVTNDRFTVPQTLFRGARLLNSWQHSNLDVRSDGQLLLLETPVVSGTTAFNVIVNRSFLLDV